MSFIPEYLKQVVGKNLIKPTVTIDKYLAESVIPRLDKDASLLETYFSKATRYTFDEKNPPKKLNEVVLASLSSKKFTSAVINNNNNKDDNDDDKSNSNTEGAKSSSTSSSISFNDIKDRIAVIEVDCLLRAKQLVDTKQYKNVSVQNMANEYNCGGAWSIHRGSQEEYIMRNSTLPLSLWKHRRAEQDGFRAWEAGTQLLGPAKDIWYPFSFYGGIYTPNVEVFSVCDEKLESNNNNNKDEFFSISVLTSAAQDLRNRNSAMPKQVWSGEVTETKLRTVFLMAIENGADALILGAFGCGAFLNKPEEVAPIYKKLIEEVCAGCEKVEDFPFKKIDFAIIKSSENTKCFQKVFA